MRTLEASARAERAVDGEFACQNQKNTLYIFPLAESSSHRAENGAAGCLNQLIHNPPRELETEAGFSYLNRP
jgi:hypothetical protein